MFELRLFYKYFKGIKIVPRLKVSMPSYSPEQASINKFYANLKKQVYNGNTDRIWAVPEPVSYCFKWVAMMRWLNWNTFMNATHWWQLLEVLAARTGSSWRKLLLESVGESPEPCGQGDLFGGLTRLICTALFVSYNGLGVLVTGRQYSRWSLCEERLPLNTRFRCWNCISLHLELLFVQDLGCPWTLPITDHNLYTCSSWAFWTDL